MRKLEDILADIERCKAQIACTFKNPNMKDVIIIRQGYQLQLRKLNTERDIVYHNLRSINPKLISNANEL